MNHDQMTVSSQNGRQFYTNYRLSQCYRGKISIILVIILVNVKPEFGSIQESLRHSAVEYQIGMNINVVKTGSDWFYPHFTLFYLSRTNLIFLISYLSSTKEIINCGFSRLANFLTNKFASYFVNIVSKLCKISVFQCPNLCFIPIW